jgi:hypothetical protein
MKEDEDEQPTCSAGAGGTSSAGKPYNPSDRDEDASGAADSSGPPKAVPIGRPVGEDEYSRRKERARDEDRPADAPAAQEDPSRRDRDG